MKAGRIVGVQALARILSAKHGVPVKTARQWVDAVAQEVAAQARTKARVVLPDLGTFRVRRREGREVPLNGGMVILPTWRLTFTPSPINKGTLV